MSSVTKERVLRDIKPSKTFFSDEFVHDKKIYDVMSSSVTRLVSNVDVDLCEDSVSDENTKTSTSDFTNIVKIYQYKVSKNQMEQYQLSSSDLKDLNISPPKDDEVEVDLNDDTDTSVLSMEKNCGVVSKDTVVDDYDWKNHYMLMSKDWDRIIYSYKHIIFSFLSLNLERHLQVEQFIKLVDLGNLHYDVHQKYLYNQQDIDSCVDSTSKMLQIDLEISNILLKQFNSLYEKLHNDDNK